MTATYRVEAKIFFVESKTKFRKKSGKPETFAVEHRKMYVNLPPSGKYSGQYRIVKRGDNFTISTIPTIEQPWWTNPTGKAEVWYTLPSDIEYDDGTIERPWKRTEDKSMDQASLIQWLAFKMGKEKAVRAVEDMLTVAPDNKLAA